MRNKGSCAALRFMQTLLKEGNLLFVCIHTPRSRYGMSHGKRRRRSQAIDILITGGINSCDNTDFAALRGVIFREHRRWTAPAPI